MTDEELLQKPKKILLAHELTFPEMLRTADPVVNLQGELIAGKDRKYESEAVKWVAWQKSVQFAAKKVGVVPQHVMDYFQETKGSLRPPETKAPRFSWSYSALSDFENCPYAYAQKRYYKTVVPKDTEATIWGTRLHEAAEKLMKGEPTEDWDAIKVVGPYVNVLKKLPGERLIEAQLAVTEGWKICDWFSGWGRGVIDFAVVNGDECKVFDYKSGSVKEDTTQLEIFCLFAALKYPQVQKFNARFIWLKNGTIGKPVELERKDLLRVIQGITARIKRMKEAWDNEVFVQRRSGLCRAYCDCLECPNNGRGR